MIKLSHSGQSKYLSCAYSYKLHYIDKWRTITFSSALVLGSAIDESLNTMLENLGNPEALNLAINAFDRKWEQGENSARELVDMPLNPLIEYSKYDFDADLLEKSDWAELFKYDSKFFETKQRVDALYHPKPDEDGNKEKAVAWLDIPEDDRMVLNYATWKCLARKGHILLKQYSEDVLPYFKEVLAVQFAVSLLDEDENDLNGVIDLVAVLDGSKLGLDYDPVAVVDNKTTSTKYEDDSVATSEQLTKYQAILNIKADDPEDEWNHKIDMCAYAVMSKKLVKDITKTCVECGNISKGSHKTCDALVEKDLGPKKGIKTVRCEGKWDKDKKFSAKTQFITGVISAEQEEAVLENANTVKSCIEMGLFPKNYNTCNNLFGRSCQFIGLCHGGDTKGLINVKDKK